MEIVEIKQIGYLYSDKYLVSSLGDFIVIDKKMQRLPYQERREWSL